MNRAVHFIFRATRRRWLQALAIGALGFCALARAEPRGFTLPAEQIDGLLARSFPYTQNFSGLVTLRLEHPRLRFLPKRDRLGTTLDFTVTELLSGQPFTGQMDLDYALGFDAAAGVIRLADVHLDRIAVDQLLPGQQQLVSLYAPQAAQLFLSGLVLYRLPASQLALMRDLGLTVQALRVLPDGVRVELGARAPATD